MALPTLKLFNREEAATIDREAWAALADSAIVANPFYEHWCLMPAMEFLEKEDRVAVATFWNDGELVALVPIKYGRTLFGVRYLEVWDHDHCFLNTPLIKPGCSWGSICELLKRHTRAHFFVLREHRGFADMAESVPFSLVHSYSRASWDKSFEFSDIVKSWKGKARRERNRERRRMFSHSSTVYRQTDDPAECLEKLDDYIALEEKGWKGSRNTAIGSRQETVNFYKAVFERGLKEKRIEMQYIAMDGEDLAASFRYRAQNQAFEIKTSFSEPHGGLAPGIILEIENLEQLCQSHYEFADSCAFLSNQAVYEIWPLRTEVFNAIYFSRSVRGFLSWLVIGLQRSRKYRSKDYSTYGRQFLAILTGRASIRSRALTDSGLADNQAGVLSSRQN